MSIPFGTMTNNLNEEPVAEYSSSSSSSAEDFALFGDWRSSPVYVPTDSTHISVYSNRSLIGLYVGNDTNPDGTDSQAFRLTMTRSHNNTFSYFTETYESGWSADNQGRVSAYVSQDYVMVASTACNRPSPQSGTTSNPPGVACETESGETSEGAIARLFAFSLIGNQTVDLGTLTYENCGREPQSGGGSNWNYKYFSPHISELSIIGTITDYKLLISHEHTWYDGTTSNGPEWPNTDTSRCKIMFNGTQLGTLPGNDYDSVDLIQITPNGTNITNLGSSFIDVDLVTFSENGNALFNAYTNGQARYTRCFDPTSNTIESTTNFSMQGSYGISGLRYVVGSIFESGATDELGLYDGRSCSVVSSHGSWPNVMTNSWTDSVHDTHILGFNSGTSPITLFGTSVPRSTTWEVVVGPLGNISFVNGTTVIDSPMAYPYTYRGYNSFPTGSSGANGVFGQVYVRDTDADGISDLTDAFRHDSQEWEDSDGDGYGNNADSCDFDFGNSSIDRNGCVDLDGDGYSDLSDAFPNEKSQIFDSDSDGFGDNITGFRGDQCPLTYGTSTLDRFGCADADGDGWSDANDVFPYDSSQWSDWDGDGFGDELIGYEGDACPSDPGNSTQDRFGCLDGDGDGWSNKGDAFPTEATQYSDRDLDGYGDNQSTGAFQPDAFPGDTTQWADADGDGYGDNPYGTLGDQFPDDPTRWQDSDNDGVADEDDAFPFDQSQANDTDGDGYGDNQNGSRPDAFPEDGNEWLDTDGDGIGNNADAFPFDPSQQTDSDGDGFGDNERGSGADKFPLDSTQWSDIDGDGYGDNAEGTNPDAFITDSTQWADADGDGYGDNPTGRLADAFTEDSTQWIDEDGDGLGDNQSGTNPDPSLNDFDNDGYNDSIDPLPKLPSPGDLDNDGVLDLNDLFPEDAREWADYDGDGEGDNADTDDDNDGWADTDEIRLGTDPFGAADVPIDSFEIVIPGTAVGLGAWDLIGMFGGIPLFMWIGFGFVTRNNRTAKYEGLLRDAQTRDELEGVARKWEYSLMLRMLGPHQGIRLERLRAELDDVFEAQNQKLSSIEPQEHDQTQMVEQAMQEEQKSLPSIESAQPEITAQGNPDGKGYEWHTDEQETSWYRNEGSKSEWQRFEA